ELRQEAKPVAKPESKPEPKAAGKSVAVPMWALVAGGVVILGLVGSLLLVVVLVAAWFVMSGMAPS
ncbi:MAG TPA: hypothetical protein PKY30_26790, partial [Myxococcota bacterium]|nr:hypothetical protein [Myxococcota bacterium]